MHLSDYLEGKLIDHIFRTASFTKPTVLAVALYTAAPTDAGGGTEVSTSGTGYARQSLNPLDANWAAPSAGNGVTSNTPVVNFGTASGSWGTVTHFGIFDATSGGNLLVWGPLSASKTVTSGDGFQVPANQLTVTFA